MKKYTKIKIAFDLDGVIIDKPPFIPKKLLEKLFRGFKSKGLHYRFPKSKLEQAVRKISHYYLFRPPIKQNIDFIKKIANDDKYELYIVSARYSFIKNETKKWLEKRKMNNLFKEIFLNTEDEQPHKYKEKILKIIKPEIFVDDDYLLAEYLSEKKVSKKIYCFSPNNVRKKVKSKLFFLKKLEELA